MFLILAQSRKHAASHSVSAWVWRVWATPFSSGTFFLSFPGTFTWTYKYTDPYTLCIADTYMDGLKKEYSFHALKKLYRVILNWELFVYSL